MDSWKKLTKMKVWFLNNSTTSLTLIFSHSNRSLRFQRFLCFFIFTHPLRRWWAYPQGVTPRYYLLSVRVVFEFSTESQDRNGWKFILLNPQNSFSEVMNLCRATVLAGGTLRPVRMRAHFRISLPSLRFFFAWREFFYLKYWSVLNSGGISDCRSCERGYWPVAYSFIFLRTRHPWG